ncbi:DUF3794 domain-containing protein [Acetonema longum]|uniref:DUF3794 domain-containing protein n=1 Tax=Acetonema longum TaxID=2374 RepID=UPI0002E98C4F|nr:DUF3794 domain-containing protein [Acetonema longum]
MDQERKEPEVQRAKHHHFHQSGHGYHGDYGHHHGQHTMLSNMCFNQVVGRAEEQKTIDIHIFVPRHKPLIEQIVDVFIKRVTVTDVRVLCDEVIVRGCFEVKALYVACLPHQPVHAVEVRRVRFTIAVPISGARRGMDVDASVFVEYVDYDVTSKMRQERLKGYSGHHDKHMDGPCCDDDGHWGDSKYGPEESYYCNYDFKPGHKPHHPHHPGHPDCDPDHHPHHPGHPGCDPHHHHHHDHGYCSFDVWVVLKACVKVMIDREVLYPPVYQQAVPLPMPPLPLKPKG